MDVKRAADLYAQGRTLRQIGAELGLTATDGERSTPQGRRHHASAVLPLIPPPRNRSWSCVTKA